MPMLTLFKNRGYRIEDYPTTYELYANEITLPLYNGLTDEQIDEVISVVAAAVEATP
jgi:dTDP-4-amino-4,6-dideoxygalactose transaminase